MDNSSSMGEIMDANWIIQKLGKHAIGKIVEVHQPSNNSWHKGTVLEVFEDASTVSVTLDDGNALNVDLGKQGIRFVQKKQRHCVNLYGSPCFALRLTFLIYSIFLDWHFLKDPNARHCKFPPLGTLSALVDLDQSFRNFLATPCRFQKLRNIRGAHEY
ncbi:hypothetical protein Tco_0899966 [Tanacetum coccineum]